MLEIRQIHNRADAEKYISKYNEKESMPEHFFHEEERNRIILGLFQGEKQVGMTYGIYNFGGSIYYQQDFRTDREYRTIPVVVDFYRMVFRWITEKYGAKHIILRTQQENEKEPPIVRLLEKMPDVRIRYKQCQRKVALDARNIDEIRKYRWYQPELLQQKGYEMIPVSDLSAEEMEAFRKKDLSSRNDSGYMPPGLWDKEWDYDPETSRLVVRKGSHEPLGWMTTMRTRLDNTLEIRRYYIQPEERERLLGRAFGVCMLDLITKDFERIEYEVVFGNKQMEMLTGKYFKPYLEFQCFLYIIDVDYCI